MKQRELRWMRLDNAAKIYPAARRRRWNNVFRVSATLTAPVKPEILQQALAAVIPRFPSIAVRLRRGVFWYYLEEIPMAPQVLPEREYPLTRMQKSDIQSCAFRILYYKNRIAAEFFHALTDGNGALIFLKTLLAEYIEQCYHVSIPCQDGVLNRTEEPREEELEDSFLRYEGPVSASRKEPTAYRLTGTPEPDGYLHITTGMLPVKELLTLAHSYHVSLTTLLVSVMILSILKIQQEENPYRKRQKPVRVLVPVNLRKLFPSTTLRNFVLYITCGVDPRMGDYSLEEIINSVHHQMGAELTAKGMASRIATNVRDEKALILRIMPLFIKNAAMKLVYNLVGERKSCLSMSNLGSVAVPKAMQHYIQRFDFVLGVQATTPSNCGIISYGDTLYINMIRNTAEATLEREFFTCLCKLGIHVLIESNQR